MHPALRMREELEDRAGLLGRFKRIRTRTRAICDGLTAEDMTIQSMPDVSPAKWHLAHTTWFFEEFLLSRFENGFVPHNDQYGYLFNSYYEAIGDRWARPQRGLLSRPPVSDVLAYREAINARVDLLVQCVSDVEWAELAPLLDIGLHHEQQHQELICTDIKHVFSINPLNPPVFGRTLQEMAPAPGAPEWVAFNGGLIEVGHGEATFAFDNEIPQHTVYAAPFELADRPVVNAEFQAFIEDGGYERSELWLSDGWAAREASGWTAPLYWRSTDGAWSEFTLHGLEPLNPSAPVAHVSFYEAAAYAAWAGARLPREHELEMAARRSTEAGRFFTPSWRAHPLPIKGEGGGALRRVYGDVWEWSLSPYAPYPGYAPPAGAIGEYNGKFMCNQMVLRGGSCVTPDDHIRPTYRNFMPPNARWQFSGLRLARDL